MRLPISKCKWERVDVELVGGRITRAQVEAHGESPDYENYYLGHCPGGIIGVRRYQEVVVRDVWPGIDWVLREREGGAEQEFIVAPGIDPGRVRLRVWGLHLPTVESGRLRLHTAYGELTETYLTAYLGSERRSLYYQKGAVYEEGGRYGQEISFRVEGLSTPPAQTLILDPALFWATYYGGGGEDRAWDISVVGAAGSERVYVVGYTLSGNFPVQSLAGAYYDGTHNSHSDAFLLRFDASGNREWATYYGGGYYDEAHGIAVVGAPGSERIYVVGHTHSGDFPLQNLAGAYNQGYAGWDDAFILRFDAQGMREWATCYGGSSYEFALKIAVTGSVGSERVYIVGWTESSNFPTQSRTGSYNQASHGGNRDAFILYLDANGARQWATWYGGSGNEEARDVAVTGTPGSERIYVVGYTNSTNFPLQSLSGAYNQPSNGGWNDAFILRFGAGGVRQWATYYGGVWDEVAAGVALVGSPGNEQAYIVGWTTSSNFPTQSLTGAYSQNYGGAVDGFVLRFGATGVRDWATYYGGSGDDDASGVAITESGGSALVYVIGYTRSNTNFPLQALTGAYNQGTHGGGADAFILRFDGNGVRDWATYYGGGGDDFSYGVAITGRERLSVVGMTNSNNLPLLTPTSSSYGQGLGGGWDMFICRFSGCDIAAVLSSGVGTNQQRVCQGTAMVDITYQIYSASVSSVAGLPTGVTYNYDSNTGTLTISGTPNDNPGSYTYTITLSPAPGACGTAPTPSGTITIEAPPSANLLSGSANQTVCVGSAIQTIIYQLSNASNAVATGLPSGVTGSYDGTTGLFTISGTPTAAGNYSYTIVISPAPSSGCTSPITVPGTITVEAPSTITLNSAAGTDNQTLCLGNPIVPIVYTASNVSGVVVTGLPTGVTYTYNPSNGRIIISGTPTAAGSFTYTISLTPTSSTCPSPSPTTGTINVLQAPGATLTSPAGTNNQTICKGSPIQAITYAISGTSSVNVTGLPSGVSANFSSSTGTLTISGTPTAAGNYSYSFTIPANACGNAVTVNGSLTVEEPAAITLSSAPGSDNQTVCQNSAIVPITYTASGASGVNVTGLPAGLAYTYNPGNGNITISGTPTTACSFTYTISLTPTSSTCPSPSPTTGTINVLQAPGATLTSPAGTNNQTICKGSPIQVITYAISGTSSVNVTGLPSGVSANFSSSTGTLTISGTPTAAGNYSYSFTIPANACGNAVTVNGSLTVEEPAAITLSSAPGSDNQTVCQNGPMDPITYTVSGASGVNVTGLPAGVTYTYNPVAGTVTISGVPTTTGSFSYGVIVTPAGNACPAPQFPTGTIIVQYCPNNHLNASGDFTWEIWPNPNEGKFTLRLNGRGQFVLIDAAGKIIPI